MCEVSRGIGLAKLHDSQSRSRQTIPKWMASRLLGVSNVPLACRSRCVSVSYESDPPDAYPNVVLGVTAVTLLHPSASLFDKAESISPGLTFFLAALIINFVLNVFSALNIAIRLLLHRRYVIAAFGRRSVQAEYSLRISSIFLESAAINLPLALLSIVGLLIEADFAALLTQIITPGQVRFTRLLGGEIFDLMVLFHYTVHCFPLNNLPSSKGKDSCRAQNQLE